MIIKSHRRVTSAAPVAPKQPEPQRIVEKKPEKKEENKKVSSLKKEIKQPVFDDMFIEDEIIITPTEE